VSEQKFDVILFFLYSLNTIGRDDACYGGIETAKLIRKMALNLSTKILVLTASQVTKELESSILESGCNSCLTKPITLQILKQVLQTL